MRNKHTHRKRRKIRYDRIAVILILSIGIPYLFFMHFSHNDNKSEDLVPNEPTELPDIESSPQTVQTENPVQEEICDYYYQFLSETEKAVYDEILESGREFSTITKISTGIDLDSFSNVLVALEYDHPEYYWFHGPSESTVNVFGNVTSVSYNADGNEESSYERIMNRAESVLNDMHAETDYEKVRCIYEWIIDNTEYDITDSEQKQTVLSVLDEGSSVCTGYAKTFKLLCDLSGIECAVVSGVAADRNLASGDHMWNLVRLNGQYYWVDPTWGDPLGIEGNNKNFDYLCISDRFINIGHTADTILRQAESGSLAVEYPECTDDSYDYYVLNGSYFETYDADSVEQYIAMNAAEGNMLFEMKFGNEEALNEAVQDLIQSNRIFEIVNRSSSSRYRALEYSSGSLFSLRILVK